jgi:hypothetical protein
MGKKLRLVGIVPLGLIITAGTPASAQQSPSDLKYLCVAEAEGGVRYNEQSRKWEGAIFRPTYKFLLHLKFKKSHVEKDRWDKEELVYEYMVTRTRLGDDYEDPCFEKS